MSKITGVVTGSASYVLGFPILRKLTIKYNKVYIFFTCVLFPDRALMYVIVSHTDSTTLAGLVKSYVFGHPILRNYVAKYIRIEKYMWSSVS